MPFSSYGWSTACLQPREAVSSAQRQSAHSLPGFFAAKRIYLAWKDDQKGTYGVFNIAPGQARSVIVLWSFIYAAIAAVLCGLPFHLTAFLTARAYASSYAHAGLHNPLATPGAGWYVVAVALLLRLVRFVPQFRYRDLPKLIAEPSYKAPSRVPHTQANDKVVVS